MFSIRKGIEFYLSILAIAISLAALIVSIQQLDQNREHNRLSVRPNIFITPYLEGNGGRNGIYIENAGLGPGILQSFQVNSPSGIYSGFGINYWEEILESNGLDASCFSKGWPDPDAAIKEGEKEVLLNINNSKPSSCFITALELFQRNDISITLGYQSMYKEVFSTSRNFSIQSEELERITALLKQYR